MALLPVCDEVYVRPNGRVLLCTWPERHMGTRHSWYPVRISDEDHLPVPLTGVQVLLDAIERGDYDQYLEAVLATGHNRKRAKHGVAGFGRVGDYLAGGGR